MDKHQHVEEKVVDVSASESRQLLSIEEESVSMLMMGSSSWMWNSAIHLTMIAGVLMLVAFTGMAIMNLTTRNKMEEKKESVATI
jgi:hypothetical protein